MRMLALRLYLSISKYLNNVEWEDWSAPSGIEPRSPAPKAAAQPKSHSLLGEAGEFSTFTVFEGSPYYHWQWKKPNTSWSLEGSWPWNDSYFERNCIVSAANLIPAGAVTCQPDLEPMLGQRRRRWPSIDSRSGSGVIEPQSVIIARATDASRNGIHDPCICIPVQIWLFIYFSRHWIHPFAKFAHTEYTVVLTFRR